MDASPHSPQSLTDWQPGERLTLRGRTWTVVHQAVYADCAILRLDGADGSSAQKAFLLPFDRPRRTGGKRIRVVSARAWQHAFERLQLGTYPHGGLRHFPPSLDVVPYQLEPALAMLRDGHPRILIADDVGLGKTIEAAVILAELAGRLEGFRALVLVPAGLKEQWSEELAARFGIAVIVADAGGLRTLGGSLPPGLNPWSLPGTYLASFDFVKRPEALRPLEDVRWDLLIVDEAHAAAVGTDRRAAVNAVASRAHRVILLTATPPADPVQSASLCRVGAGPGDPDIVMLQRCRGGDAAARRRSVVLAVRLTEEERRMHRLVERYTTLVWREASRLGSMHGRLATVILRKRALSSAASLELSLRRRRDLLARAVVPPELQLVLPLDGEEDAREDVVLDELLAAPGLRDAAGELRWLEAAIASAAAAAGLESKARMLVRLLSRAGQPAIVFTEYRDTLERLRSLLDESNLPACALHGGLSPAERREALAEFARGGRTLLATDAAAEGLNLQHACRMIVHFELPWNPSRMLQRAGRVDRIGQSRRVHEIALVASDTAESLVLAPLARRAMAWRQAGGARMMELLTESRVAAAVFENVPPHPSADPTDRPCLSLDLVSDAIAEALRLERCRTIARRLRGPIGGHPQLLNIPVTMVRTCALPEGIVLLFELTTTVAARQVVERALAAVHVSMAVQPWPRTPSRIRERVADVLPQLIAAASSAVDGLKRGRLDIVRPSVAAAAERERNRTRSVRRSHDSAARQLVQAGLFERRTAAAGLEPGEKANLLEAPANEDGETELIASADLCAVLLVSRR